MDAQDKPSAPRTLCLINEDEEDEEGDEEEDIPEDLQDLSPEQQQVSLYIASLSLLSHFYILMDIIFVSKRFDVNE